MKTLLMSLISTFLVASPAFAKKASAPLAVENGFIYVPLKGSNATAAYGTLKNLSGSSIEVSIVNAASFKAVELHETVEKDGLMKMQKVNSFRLEKGGAFELKPGGHHIMLFDAEKEFKEGDVTEVTFQVGKDQLKLKFPMKARASQGHSHH